MASIIGVETLQHTNGTTAATIDSSGLLLPKTPAFQVEATDTDQSITVGSPRKIEWETVKLDTVSGWDATNHRYTASVAGWYSVGGIIRANMANRLQYYTFSIRKNGTSVVSTQLNGGTFGDFIENGQYALPNALVKLNGSTDYIEVFAGADETFTAHDTAGEPSVFFGFLVHAT